MAGQAEIDWQGLHHVQAVQELARGVGRVAEVVVERDPSQDVVARQDQAPVGLVEADVRGRVARRLVHLPRPEVGIDLHPVHQLAVRRHELGDADALAAARLPVALERRQRHPALGGNLDPPLQHPLRVLDRAGHVLVVRVHPQLTAGRLHDRGGQAVVVRVGVGAHQEAHVLQPQPRLVQRALELAERPGLVHAGVDQHHPAAGRDREGVHVRHARPGQGQAQAPQAGHDPVGAREVAFSAGFGHDWGRLPEGRAILSVMRLDKLRDLPRDARARPGLPPTRERVDDLARSISSGRYRVSVDEVAEAMITAARARSAPRG